MSGGQRAEGVGNLRLLSTVEPSVYSLFVSRIYVRDLQHIWGKTATETNRGVPVHLFHPRHDAKISASANTTQVKRNSSASK